MMVTFISQCEKNALKKTRRVLDAFADRIGDNTWQTVITEAGLNTVKKMLRQTASKSTAVSCHWIRSRSRSQFLWVVGNKSKFDERGVVPVNFTENAIAQYMDSGQWKMLEVIKYAAAIAGLFHDFGKANLLFQIKLKPKNKNTDSKIYEPYRHEWVSLRLFQEFVGEKKDSEWMNALSEIDRDEVLICFRDGIDGNMGDAHPQSHPLTNLPPFGKLVAWLILTHHKLPLNPGWLKEYKSDTPELRHEDKWLADSFSAVWNSPKCKEQDEKHRIADNWNFEKGLPIKSEKWRARACELASEAKVILRPILAESTFWLESQLFTSHIARLCLMLADHSYSARTLAEMEEKYRSSKYAVYANTEKTGSRTDYKQKLDEHLIGVAHYAGKIAKALPRFNGSLVPLGEVRPLEELVRKNKELNENGKKNFGWQDDAIAEAEKLGKATLKQGFFGINMASTGKGKTLGNAKIMYALGQQTGRERFSVALGLRTLTLQTGKAYREKLALNEEQLAIMVGGVAVKQLFENEQNQFENTVAPKVENVELSAEDSGSESQDELLDPDLFVDYLGDVKSHSLSDWTKKNSRLEKLISAPVLVCTIDHLIPASEGTKGGKQIGPMLRLLSSDLVIDEPDDFGLEDLSALCRLVHWAGMLGSRVLISTATMPPALAYALFQAYQAGWAHYALANIPDWDKNIICAWFDEYGSYKNNGAYNDFEVFRQSHDKFGSRRVDALKKENKVKRKGIILPIADDPEQTNIQRMASTIHEKIDEMHHQHFQAAKDKRISIGLVRMANIDPLVAVAKELLKRNAPSNNTVIHYCIYHSHYPLAIRHNIESKLDRILKRKDPDAIWQHEEIQTALKKFPVSNHIFVVVASPVAEVGRDHDYDWAIVEPSSVRSIIQLAGRVLRHRDHVPPAPNIGLLDKNYKALKGERICFERPGFEYRNKGPKMKKAKHNLSDILKSEYYSVIDATSRIIQPRYNAKEHEFEDLVHLEHRALAFSLFNKSSENKPIAANIWWQANPHWCGEVQRQQRFRKSEPDEAYYLWLADKDADPTWRWMNENVRPPKFGEGAIRFTSISSANIRLGVGSNFWFQLDAKTIYYMLSRDLPDIDEGDLAAVSQRFGELRLIEYSNSSDQEYEYHPELGVYKKLEGNTDE